jgi:hypothetical protein
VQIAPLAEIISVRGAFLGQNTLINNVNNQLTAGE